MTGWSCALPSNNIPMLDCMTSRRECLPFCLTSICKLPSHILLLYIHSSLSTPSQIIMYMTHPIRTAPSQSQSPIPPSQIPPPPCQLQLQPTQPRPSHAPFRLLLQKPHPQSNSTRIRSQYTLGRMTDRRDIHVLDPSSGRDLRMLVYMASCSRDASSRVAEPSRVEDSLFGGRESDCRYGFRCSRGRVMTS